ncbi:MAG: hypothetical protein ACR2HW_03015 [Gemmatimonadales bacterium]
MTEAKRGSRLGWLTPRPGAIVGALLLGGLPMWTLPLMATGSWGFLAYLSLSHAYYGGARRLFGATLFPPQEFGIIPNGVPGILVATVLYAAVGGLIGWAIGSASTKRRSAAVLVFFVVPTVTGSAAGQQPEVQLARRVLVSSLDSTFPSVPLGRWLAELPGRPANTVQWETNDCGEGGDGLEAPTCVEAVLQVAPDATARLSLVITGTDGTPGPPAIWMLYGIAGDSINNFKALREWAAYVRRAGT